jgi:hypothetical protein
MESVCLEPLEVNLPSTEVSDVGSNQAIHLGPRRSVIPVMVRRTPEGRQVVDLWMSRKVEL